MLKLQNYLLWGKQVIFLFQLAMDHLQNDNCQSSKILLDEILYFESQRDYVKIITESKTFKVHEQISSFEERLRLRGFLRIHRSFIVPVNKIESWSAYKIEIKKYTLPIGRTFSKEVLRILKARINNL